MSTGKRTPRRYIIGLAVALGLPLSFYVLAKLLSKDMVPMPRYYHATGMGTYTNDKGKEVTDSLYFHVPALIGVNQLGDSVDLNEDLKEKLLVVNFFFTSCPTICPKLSTNMRLLQNAYRRTAMKQNDDLVQFISITVNPEKDSTPVLRAYADKFGANHDHWWFITGNKDSLFRYGKDYLKLYDPEGSGGAGEFAHSPTIVLLDKNRHIRGYYNGLDSLEIRRCANDIGWLNMEKHPRP